MRLVPIVLIIALTNLAAADGWVVAETPAALALSEAQQGAFRPGLMPAVGAYAGNGRVAVGLRLRAGILRDGPSPGDQLRDPGVGGLGTAGVAVRVGGRGAWAEVVVGGGLTGRDLVPAVEAGIGWSFDAGTFEIGPGARYARVVSRDAMDAFGSVDLLLLGVDVRVGRDRGRSRVRVERDERVEPPAAARPTALAAAVPAERDHDRIIDREASCVTERDGCPDRAIEIAAAYADAITVVDDRIILDERVLFDLNYARVRSRGRALVEVIAGMWHEQPSWQRMTIEGHADARGSDAFNLALSQRRAERVRDQLLKHGFTADRIDAIGFGRSRPRSAGSSQEAHDANRRVEFVIHREVMP